MKSSSGSRTSARSARRFAERLRALLRGLAAQVLGARSRRAGTRRFAWPRDWLASSLAPKLQRSPPSAATQGGCGIAASRSLVYCACGATSTRSVGPCSTMRPALHDDDTIAQQAHHIQIMRHEQIAHAQRLLEVLQQIEHHRLHRDVERGGRLVEDDEFGIAARSRARCRRAPSARRRADAESGRADSSGRPTWRGELLAARAHRVAPLTSPSRRIGSAMARAAVKRGLRLSVGSWNTIWMRLRSGSRANCLAGMPPMSSPSNMMQPVGLVDQPHHHRRGGRLAAAGFADQADALAAIDGEADAVDGAEHLRLGRRLALEQFAEHGRSRPGADIP